MMTTLQITRSTKFSHVHARSWLCWNIVMYIWVPYWNPVLKKYLVLVFLWYSNEIYSYISFNLTTFFFSHLVLDFNDNPPLWRQDSYSCRVSAEAQPGHVVTSVSATDPDSGQVTPLSYSIHSGDRDAIFKMDQLTGKINLLLQVSSFYFS